MEELLEQLLDECRHYTKEGAVATYIPELAKADENEFGICVVSEENGIIGVVLFLAMCLVFVYNILKIYKKGGIAKYFAITLFVSYMGLCLCGMTDCIFYGLKPLQYLMMILGLTQACANMKIEKTNEEKEQAE